MTTVVRVLPATEGLRKMDPTFILASSMNKTDTKQISMKVSKVREVVSGVSTNDIILALHSYDLNVERTIQAFCEDGASGVLDDWVRPVGGGGKNKNNKKKNKAPAAVAPVPVATLAKEPVNCAVPAPVTPQPSKAASTVNEKKGQTNVVPESGPARDQIRQVFKNLRTIMLERENALLATCNTKSHFSGEAAQLISSIRSFGIVHDGAKAPAAIQPAKSVSPVQAAAIKHATSQSSLTSSVGADSGVNLSPVHKEEKKQVQSANAPGGIFMSSDALSADQLAAIQQSLQQRLAESGIDASILSGVTQGDMPVRKSKKAIDGRGSKAGKTGKQQTTNPKLSILNA